MATGDGTMRRERKARRDPRRAQQDEAEGEAQHDGEREGERERVGAHRRAGRWVMGFFRFARTLGRALAAAWDKDATERAAALTYYAVLALFPALLMTFSLIGLAGGPSDSHLAAGLTALLPAPSRSAVSDTLQRMAEDTSATTSLAVVSGVGAAWSACSYAAVFRRALHHVHGVEDHRPAWRTAPRILLTSVTLLVALVSGTVCLVVSGELSRRAGALLHVAGPLVSAWRGLRWPLLLVVAAVLVLVLFRSGPRGTRSLRTMAPGGAVAVGLWLLASAGFAVYTARMDTYHRLYGPLGGAVAFLVWLWLSNLALMVGAHFNVEHARALIRRSRPAETPTEPAPAH
ncbi:YihY/virulence factor BrkB family protein [Streptomyces sp. V4-01]|uniref:YihY/virulence factor BrkB family protein n=1 Tax=Actinacidiphila polyblastidii TaxID=3110430 RepID=A0ABU7PJV8_9ACTN|nr:YihY/virulence factor BrkB family protein [Streptomyces sp. V4-01]